MLTVNLRKVGGSVVFAVPPSVLKALSLKAGESVGIVVDNGKLIVEPKVAPRYTLEELLANTDYTENLENSDSAWVAGPAVGDELL